MIYATWSAGEVISGIGVTLVITSSPPSHARACASLHIATSKFAHLNNLQTNNNKIKNKWSILESIRHRFASFDTLVQLTPITFINLCRWLVFSVIIYSFYLYNNGFADINLFILVCLILFICIDFFEFFKIFPT